MRTPSGTRGERRRPRNNGGFHAIKLQLPHAHAARRTALRTRATENQPGGSIATRPEITPRSRALTISLFNLIVNIKYACELNITASTGRSDASAFFTHEGQTRQSGCRLRPIARGPGCAID